MYLTFAFLVPFESLNIPKINNIHEVWIYAPSNAVIFTIWFNIQEATDKIQTTLSNLLTLHRGR